MMDDRKRYLAGWQASKTTRTYDLDAAEARHERKHGDDTRAMFAAGWSDYAADRIKFASLPAGKPADPCNCEHVDHEDGTGHAYMAVAAGDYRAQHVGRICDACAAGHLAEYLTAMPVDALDGQGNEPADDDRDPITRM